MAIILGLLQKYLKKKLNDLIVLFKGYSLPSFFKNFLKKESNSFLELLGYSFAFFPKYLKS